MFIQIVLSLGLFISPTVFAQSENSNTISLEKSSCSNVRAYNLISSWTPNNENPEVYTGTDIPMNAMEESGIIFSLADCEAIKNEFDRIENLEKPSPEQEKENIKAGKRPFNPMVTRCEPIAISSCDLKFKTQGIGRGLHLFGDAIHCEMFLMINDRAAWDADPNYTEKHCKAVY